MVDINKAVVCKAKRRDLFARIVITLGGVTIIASVIGILLLIVGVTLPLFLGAVSEIMIRTPLPDGVAADDILAVGIDRVELEQRGVEDADSVSAYTLARDGTVTFLDFSPAARAKTVAQDASAAGTDLYEVLGRKKAEPPGQDDDLTIVAADTSGTMKHCLLWSDGSLSLLEVVLEAQFDDLGRRSVRHGLKTLATLPAEGAGSEPIRAVARIDSDGGTTWAKLVPNGRIDVTREVVRVTPLGVTSSKKQTITIESDIPGTISAMTLNKAGNTLYAGTENGQLARWKIDKKGRISDREVIKAFDDRRAVTALAMVFGDVSIAVGDAEGNVVTWFPVRREGTKRFAPVHHLSQHGSPIVDIFPSERNKSLLSIDREGGASLDYTTSERQLLSIEGPSPLRLAGYSPRGNAMIGLDADGRLALWNFDWQAGDYSHPEVSWTTLFGKVHYENHDEPKYMWQSSGTDEPKLSLVPVIFGTLKSTIYAMLFAIPLALFSAMYVSHFTTPRFKRAIKPVVEVMAAVPTVVVGFLILLWAAPLVGKWIVGVFASLVTIPVTFVVFMMLWQLLRRFDWAKRLENGYEFMILIPVMVLGVLLAMWICAPVENQLFDGDFRQWLYNASQGDLSYEQLNTLVVSFGLGFAVIPIIFSISEDALSSIPHEMTAASFALGASRWQTVWRVILPSASPGIFAAIMIGFGRAVGETMIVFMAAGNTPILDWSPFNGFRTLSANIAMETPEAARNSTLYRVLFLCAVLLFILTFLLNTAAEIVRVRLRKKYGQY